MIPFFIFLSLSLYASTDSMNLFEKSYPRDNTFCSHKKMKVELMIRGGNKFTEPKERGYGEFIFYRHPLKRPQLLKLNELRSDTYKLFKGVGPVCSKSYGYQVDSKLAVLLLKENKPFMDKLVIQMFDAESLSPTEVIETDYLTDMAQQAPGGFSFRTIVENHNPDIGRVKIDGENFIFQEKDFPQWIGYSGRGFEVNPDQTFDKLPWKSYFSDQEDFLQLTNWDGELKKFGKNVIYHAVSHKLKKQCLLFIEKKQKLAGNEIWRCHTM